MNPADHGSWPAPAKLNLFLHVTGRRSDGYHLLQTVFQILDWGDELTFEVTAEPVIRQAREIRGLAEADDLSIRAARLLQHETGIHQGARISLTKRIPMGSGLGGASTDAATTLVALNKLWSCHLGVDELAELALRLGADVPLFVRGHTAWAEGTGERLQRIELGVRHYVLVFPDLQVSTARVFASDLLKRDSVPLDQPPGSFENCRNDCENVVLDMHPELAELVSDLANFGEPRMTGTGSTFFLPVASKNHAERLTTELKSRYNVRAVTGVDKSPLMECLTRG